MILFDEPYIVMPATTISQPEPQKPKEITQPSIFVENTLPETITKTIIDNDPVSAHGLEGAFTTLPLEPMAPEVVDIAEKMPTFTGGEKAFYAYVSTNIKYPNLSKKTIQQEKHWCNSSLTPMVL